MVSGNISLLMMIKLSRNIHRIVILIYQNTLPMQLVKNIPIGISYEEVIQDGERQYIFINDDQIVKEYSSHCDINLSKHPAYAIGQKYSNTSLIQVEKKKIKGEVYYQVEEIKN